MPKLFDTDVFSYILKNDTRGINYESYLVEPPCLSFITVGELYYWSEKRSWELPARLKLDEKLSEFIILEYNDEVARLYGRVRAGLEKNGISLSPNDLWIAATALAYECDMITHNRRHFSRVPGLKVISH